MSNKHTPGPWKAKRSTEFNAHKPDGISDYWYISDRWYDDSHEQIVSFKVRNEANARLIAAAPEMLEALKDALEHIPCKCNCWDDRGDCPHDKMRTAIAKAEGRE